MRKTALIIFAGIALAGILSCAVIEPAFAFQDAAAHSDYHDVDTDSCFIHCSVHHQWTNADASIIIPHVLSFENVIPEINSEYRHSPDRSIFHPPLAF